MNQIFFAFLVLSGLLIAHPGYACSVCFGQADSTIRAGLKIAIFALLGVLLSIFTGIVFFFINISRRLKQPLITAH